VESGLDHRRTELSETPAASRAADDARELARPTGRPVFVVLGMHGSGGTTLARVLQLLGVDIAPADAADNWERPEISGINDRLLALLGRPLSGPAHALPFPAGWWSDPRIQAVKRDAQAVLRAALADRYGAWGFKDARVSRLLPFWDQVFDEMELAPAYLWAVRDPAGCAAAAVARGLAADAGVAQAMWFVYNADIHKGLGDGAALVVDHQAWADRPEAVVAAILDRLPLAWRGTPAELTECVRAIAVDRPTSPPASPVHSPVVQSFFDALRDVEGSEASRRYRVQVTQAVEVLRTLVTPFAALVAGAPASLPAPLPPPPAPTSDGALLARAEQAEAALRETEEVLTREIEARVSENAWLGRQFADAKRRLAEAANPSAEAAPARAELDAALDLARTTQRKLDDLYAAGERQRREAKEELERVQRDLQVQKAANEKYLSRIYELKAQRKTDAAAAAPAA